MLLQFPGILRTRLPRRWEHRAPRAVTELLVAVAVSIVAVVARYALVPWTGYAAPFSFNFVAILAATLFAGWRSGLLAVACSQALAWFVVVQPEWSFDLRSPADATALVLATSAELLLVLIITLYQREIDRAAKEQERQLEVREMLVAELNHRVKNSLAIVQSLAHHSLKPPKTFSEATAAFDGRLSALARTHNLITRDNWKSASVQELVGEALAPFCTDEQCSTRGPDHHFEPETAVNFALALHELATNASKYGALSVAEGRVDVAWEVRNGRFELVWSERGGPEVKAGKSGFGTKMVKRALLGKLNGTADFNFAPGGVICRLSAAA